MYKKQLLQSAADVTPAAVTTLVGVFEAGVVPGEPLLTLKAAGAARNIPIFKLRKAAKQGAFPIYRVGNGRALCRLSEVDAAINASRDGGVQ